MKKLAEHMDKKLLLLICVSFVISLVFLMFASPYSTPLNDYYGYDSAVFTVLGRGTAEGRIPYLDLYDNKGPMIFYIDALGWLMGGRLGIFFLQVIFMTFVLITIYKMARLFVGIGWAWLSWAIFAFLYCGTVGEGNMTEEWSLIFTLLPLYMALGYIRKKQLIGEHPLWYSLVYGLCIGVQLMFRVTNAFPLGGMIIAFAVLLIREKNYKALWKNALIVLLGVVIVIAPFVLYFRKVGAFDYFIYASLLHNFHYAAGGAADKTVLDWLYLLARVSMTFVTVVLSVLFVRKEKISKEEALLICCADIVGSVAMIFGYSYKHYFLLLAPAILASFVMLSEGIERSALLKKKLACLLLALFCVLPYAPQSAIHAGKSILFNFCGYLDSEVKAMEEINSHITDHRDSVWGYDASANVYMYLDVVPCFRHFTTQVWMMQDSPFTRTEIENLLENDPPVWVVAAWEDDDVRTMLTETYGYELEISLEYGGALGLYHFPTE